MAKDVSFDVVSTIDVQEVDNAVQQCAREMAQRYDLKGSGASISLSKAEETITILAPSDFVAQQVIDVLNSKLFKRKVELNSIHWSDPQAASGSTVRLVGTLVSGISSDLAKKINKEIRDLKLKVKVTIEGDKLRVSSAKKDTLQEVIAFLKEKDYGQPLQYVNYR